jgi:L-rhamnose isomerase/sugar isomerase
VFLTINELAEADMCPREGQFEGGLRPSYMIDPSHNMTDSIEAMLSSAVASTASFTKALPVDRDALYAAQEGNDTMMALQALCRPCNVDEAPILAKARAEAGGAIDVLAVYRQKPLARTQGAGAQGRGAGCGDRLKRRSNRTQECDRETARP